MPRLHAHRAASLSLPALVLVSCRHEPPAPSALVASAAYRVELSAVGLTGERGSPAPFLVESSSAVVPPDPANPHCPGGRLVLATSDYNRGKPDHLYLSRDLSCLDRPECFRPLTAQLAGAPGLHRAGTFALQRSERLDDSGRCLQQNDPAGYTLEPSFPTSLGGTDQIILWTPRPAAGSEGRLLHLWQGGVYDAPAYPNVDSRRWQNGRPPPASCRSPLLRYGFFVRFSDDCGETWSEPTHVDLATTPTAVGPYYPLERVENGVYVPRGPGVSWGTDRPELFFDALGANTPLYASMDATLSTGRYDLLLRSDDGGIRWRTAYNFPDFGGGPKVMTSTPERLYVVRCLGQRDAEGRFAIYPELSWFDRNGTRRLGHVSIPYVRDGKRIECHRVDPELMVGAPGGLGDMSLSRGPDSDRDHDSLRMFYGNAPPGGPQSLYVVGVRIDRRRSCLEHPERCLEVTSDGRFDPPAGLTTFHATVIDPTPAPGVPAMDSLVQMQLWSLLPGRTATPMRLWLTARNTLEDLTPLGPTWEPALGCHHFIGDYNYGSFFWSRPGSGSPLGNYLTLWPGSLAILEPNLFLRHRILTVATH